MRVIGISPLDKDATVSFLEDGHVVFACAEERLSRVKLQSGFPDRALTLGFERTGWGIGSIDAVAYAFFDWDEEARLIRAGLATDGQKHGPDSTANSIARFRQALAAEYHVDRTRRIPGLDTPASEFVPGKAWWKRVVYNAASGSALGDWATHRRYFRRWV